MATYRCIDIIKALNPQVRVLEEMDAKTHVSYDFVKFHRALRIEVELTLPNNNAKTFIVDRFITLKPVKDEDITGERILMKIVGAGRFIQTTNSFEEWCWVMRKDVDSIVSHNNYHDAVENNNRFKSVIGDEMYEKFMKGDMSYCWDS